MPIGLATFTRHQHNQSEVRVSVPDSKDPAPLQKLKLTIEAMTCYSPRARLPASEVMRRIDALNLEVRDAR